MRGGHPLRRPLTALLSDLYVADVANMRIRRIHDPAGASPTIDTIAGLPTLPTLAKMVAGDIDVPDGTPAAQAPFVLPVAVAIVGSTLYVAEAGTNRLDSFQGEIGDLPIGNLPRVGPRIRRIDLADPRHPITTLIGSGAASDPLGGEKLGLVLGLAVDPKGRLILVDTGSNQLRRLDRIP